MKPEVIKILSMIEAADQKDNGALDAIDMAVEELIEGKKLTFEKIKYGRLPNDAGFVILQPWSDDDGTLVRVSGTSYTQSIDAQEEYLRKEGTFVYVTNFNRELSWFQADGFIDADEIRDIVSPRLPTESLARLHAWMQVWGMEE